MTIKRELEAKKLGGIGASEAYPLFVKDYENSSSYRGLIVSKVEELILGFGKTITNEHLTHGIETEEEAYNYIVDNMHPEAILCSQDSVFYKESMWATPDVFIGKDRLLNIKCPTSIFSFFSNIKKVSRSYVVQAHWEMFVTGIDKHSFFYYLSPVVSELSEPKVRSINVVTENEIMDEIEPRFDLFISNRNILFDQAMMAPHLEPEEFYACCQTHNMTRLKQKSNIFNWANELVVYNNTLYVRQAIG